MAYRRRQGNSNRSSTFEDHRTVTLPSAASAGESPSLAAQAISASSARRDSSLSSAYGDSAFSSARRRSGPDRSAYEFPSEKNFDEPRGGFWGVLARKAKSIIEDDPTAPQFQNSNRNQPQTLDRSIDHQFDDHSGQSSENPTIQKRLDAITSSLNYIGGRVGNVLEEGFSAVENRTANIIQETRKLNIRRKTSGPNIQNQMVDPSGFPQMQTDYETQLKASRDVANAMAAKAKLLMRELKTVKADLAFAKERCSQLEEENKILREGQDRGDHPEDDDLVRLQLETLLAEKARLANENSIYARENRFLREIVEYHQLTMQDVVYLNEGIEEVTEVYHMPTALSHDPTGSPSQSAQASTADSHPDLVQPSITSESLPPQSSGVEDPVIAVSELSEKKTELPVTGPENASSVTER